MNESAIETKPLITVLVPPAYDDPSTHTNHISPTVMIPLDTQFREIQYDASGQLGEFNDLNEDIFWEYFEENKNDIVPIQTDDQANVVPKTTQMQTYHGHKCTDCDQQFSTKSILKTHRASHVNMRSYECWLCHEL